MSPQQEHQYIHIGDFTRFIRRRKKRYLAIAGAFAFLSMGVVSMIEPTYVLHASFKEASMRNEASSANMLKTLLKSPGQVDLGTQALSVMKSRQLLEVVAGQLNLQAEIKGVHVANRLKSKIIKRFIQGKGIERSRCQCTNLLYKGKEIKRFEVKKNEAGVVEVYSRQQQKILVPIKGTIYQDEGVIFSLEYDAKEAVLLEIVPMQTAIDRMLNQLKVKVRRDDVTMLDLVYRDTDPARGAMILNTLMKEYKYYLVKEHERIAGAQLDYLTKRQQEIGGKLDDVLQRHVEYLEDNLGDQGLMGLHQELEIIENRKKRHHQRVLEIDFELDKLGRIKGQKLFTLESLGPEGKRLQQELLGLKKQKEGLEFVKLKRGALVAQRSKAQEPLGARSTVRIHYGSEGISTLEHKKRIVERDMILGSMYVLPVFSSIRNHLMELYSKKEQYDLRNLSGKTPDVILPLELQGMDLEMAKQLHLEYTHELDETLLKKRELQLALNQLQNEQFEVNSLAHLIGEKASQEILQETTRLSADLNNSPYFSEKERTRMKQQLSRNKKFLTHYFLDMMHLSDLRSQLVAEKIESLQHMMKDLITQEIIVVEEQMNQMLEEQLTTLQAEKKYIQEQLAQVQEELKEIPQKWLMENRMQLQSDLNISMMEGMSQLVESKNIEHHLLQVESKPIDEAYIPLKPKQVPILLCGILGGLLGTVAMMGIEIGARMARGFPVSVEGLRFRSLRAVGPCIQSTFGQLDLLSQQQLEMLRTMTSFLSEDEVGTIGIVVDSQLDYSHLLGELLVLSGKNTLVIELFCKAEGGIGLLDYLTGASRQLVIEKQGVLDIMPLGRSSPYRMEILSRREWSVLLKDLQREYQMILLVTQAPANSSEAKSLLQQCHKMIITLDEESFDDLYPYIQQEQTMQDFCALYVAFE